MLMPANESQSNQYCLLQLLGKSIYLYKQKWQTLSNYQKKKKSNIGLQPFTVSQILLL